MKGFVEEITFELALDKEKAKSGDKSSRIQGRFWFDGNRVNTKRSFVFFKIAVE